MNRIAGLVAALSLFVVACGGGDPCTTKPKCANEPAPTEVTITACRAQSADCKAKLSALVDCFNSKGTCTADGKFDPASAAACTTEASAYSSACFDK